MAELVPQPFPVLLARILEEMRRQDSIFDLPRRSWWRAPEDLDLSVRFHGERAANAAGPAAGPQSQLAANLVLSWLAGARVLELKTIQVDDRLRIPRPCIDAATVGYNVEWSQELRLEESLAEYVSGWFLIHVLGALNPAGSPPASHDTLFDFSVGYDLAGIRSGAVARWLDTLRDAGTLIRALRDSLPPGLRRVAEVEVPSRLSACVTLSTFHGCPAGEIESIVEHLLGRHGVHVVVKLNPTLLGHDEVEDLLRGRLGYEEVLLDRPSFERDLQWDQALPMFERLGRRAAAAGLSLGAKFTNTLVVTNHKGFFRDRLMYLSGEPLHVIATTLAERFTRATGFRHGLSFSAGIDAGNFHEAVACGMVPVTACTDLLRPGGYARMPRYLRRLEEEMRALGARTVPGFVLRRAGATDPAGGDAAVRSAALANLSAYAARLPLEGRYHAVRNRRAPRKLGSALALLDCVSCDKCVPVCPQDANFHVAWEPAAVETWDLVVEAGTVRARPARFESGRERQWATFADLCNECGNCDVFCPEDGGPYRVKPRFFGSRRTFEAVAPQDGLLVEDGGRRVLFRMGGRLHHLELGAGQGDSLFGDGVVEARLDAAHRVVEARCLPGTPDGHCLPLGRYHAVRLLRDATLAGINPVSAALLAAGWR
ncbi:MAG: 4Fe-4S dicluster domain-containing protein [Planctomycetes bacterium]|nr:4Fe-4S dicluster domain-containing protein [Planctomycetota bacterium]